MSDPGLRSANEYPVSHCERPQCKITVLEPYGIRLLPKWWTELAGEIRCRRCNAVWVDKTNSNQFGF